MSPRQCHETSQCRRLLALASSHASFAQFSAENFSYRFPIRYRSFGIFSALPLKETAMLTMRTTLIAAAMLTALACIPHAVAAEASTSSSAASGAGTMPGDETLTCEQIYAEGMAQKEREQQERNAQSER